MKRSAWKVILLDSVSQSERQSERHVKIKLSETQLSKFVLNVCAVSWGIILLSKTNLEIRFFFYFKKSIFTPKQTVEDWAYIVHFYYDSFLKFVSISVIFLQFLFI